LVGIFRALDSSAAVRGSGRAMIEGRVVSILATGCTLLAKQILQLKVVESPDLVAQIVDQFEHCKRLLRCPGTGDLDGERTQMLRQLWSGGVLMIWRRGAVVRAVRCDRELP
jgi:hypothetical protein